MSKRKSKTEFYVDNAGEHRWRKVAANDVTVGASSEGFSSKQQAVINAQKMGYGGKGIKNVIKKKK